MRWEGLFRDLEAQLDAAEEADLVGEIAERSRLEIARVALVDRLRMAVGAELTLQLFGGASVQGAVERVGADWLLLDAAGQPPALVPLGAIAAMSGLPALAGDAAGIGAVAARLDLAYALRVIARDRSAVTVVLRDGSRLAGTIDRVGADFVELAEHPQGEPRRSAGVRAARTIPLAGLAVVRPG